MDPDDLRGVSTVKMLVVAMGTGMYKVLVVVMGGSVFEVLVVAVGRSVFEVFVVTREISDAGRLLRGSSIRARRMVSSAGVRGQVLWNV